MPLFVLTLATAAPGRQLVIDGFDYPDTAAARVAWTPQAGAAPVALTTRNGGRAIALTADLSKVKDRLYYDRATKLDLARYGRITLWVRVDRPGAFGGATIYFRSGDGWYRGNFTIEGLTWRQVTLDRSDFREEDAPAGWHRIDAIRLSFWKRGGTAVRRATVAVDDIVAHTAGIVVVRGDLSIRRGDQGNAAAQYAAAMARLLRDGGVEFTVINDTDVERGGLDGAELAIFPHNPDMSPRELDAVGRFIDADGRIMLFYNLPGPLARRLGVRDRGWVQRDWPGQFDSIVLDTQAIPGLPGSIQQDSWNVHRPQPVDDTTRVLGRWAGAAGKATDRPAVTMGPAGLYMAHVLTPGDDAAKQRFLVAAIGRLVPQRRSELARTVLRRAQRVEGFETIQELGRWVASQAGQVPAPRAERAAALLRDAQTRWQQGAAQVDLGGPQTLAAALDTRDAVQAALRQAAWLSFPSWQPAFRGVWCHSAFGIEGWTWDQAIRHLREHGINAIVVNMLWAARAYYPSEVLPVAPEVATRGDQIAACLAACRKYGVQMHVWKVNYNLRGAPREWMDRLRREGRLQADRSGKEIAWLEPSDPANVQLERDSMLEVVRKYDVDGIHFDYIRYPNRQSGYSAAARKRFERDRKLEVAEWPADVISGPHAAAFDAWRCEQVSRLVESVAAEAREVRPGVKVSAAVFHSYPDCRRSVGQDWLLWVRRGWLDFVCPMDYLGSNAVFAATVKRQLQHVAGQIPVYPGIGVTASAGGLSAIQTAQQLTVARHLGAPGFILFNYEPRTAREHLPALRTGVLAP